jgi:hypothetical protein
LVGWWLVGGWLIGWWLVGLLVGWLVVGWLVSWWLVGWWLVCWLVGWLVRYSLGAPFLYNTMYQDYELFYLLNALVKRYLGMDLSCECNSI